MNQINSLKYYTAILTFFWRSDISPIWLDQIERVFSLALISHGSFFNINLDKFLYIISEEWSGLDKIRLAKITLLVEKFVFFKLLSFSREHWCIKEKIKDLSNRFFIRFLQIFFVELMRLLKFRKEQLPKNALLNLTYLNCKHMALSRKDRALQLNSTARMIFELFPLISLKVLENCMYLIKPISVLNVNAILFKKKSATGKTRMVMCQILTFSIDKFSIKRGKYNFVKYKMFKSFLPSFSPNKHLNLSIQFENVCQSYSDLDIRMREKILSKENCHKTTALKCYHRFFDAISKFAISSP
jgi:hypothetical protein